MPEDDDDRVGESDRARLLWRIAGITLVTVFVLGGLAVIGMVIAFMVGMNEWASNK